MKYKKLVESTICKMSPSVFEKLKLLLLGEYISFSIIDHESVTVEILAEKICDYFGTLEIKTGKPFDKFIETYKNDLDSIVGPHIARPPQAKKGETTPVAEPRSWKYYRNAVDIKGKKKLSVTQLIDYTRIMMCLYSAADKTEGKPIENFDYSADCLDPEHIIESMRNEEVSIVFPPSKKKRFDTKEHYSDDVCTLILSILILYAIVNGKVEREADHE